MLRFIYLFMICVCFSLGTFFYNDYKFKTSNEVKTIKNWTNENNLIFLDAKKVEFTVSDKLIKGISFATIHKFSKSNKIDNYLFIDNYVYEYQNNELKKVELEKLKMN